MTPSLREATGDLHLESIHKTFGDFVAVHDLDLVVPRGSFFALLGPSGCGKTTTLRMVAGLDQPTSGRVLVGDTDLTGSRPFQRPVNTVFQSYALFPHLTAGENVAFGPRRRGLKDAAALTAGALELVQMTDFARRKPSQLSGGQQQRVALARAIVNRPEVLLLDEPLGALDLKLRRQMQVELKRIQTEVGLTFIHVTHDQEEAMTMADTVAVMNQGRIEQMGAPEALYDLPETSFVANFLGQANLVLGEVRGTLDDAIEVDVAGQRLVVPHARAHDKVGTVILGVRPEKVRAVQPGAGSGNVLPGATIRDVSFSGVSTQYLLETRGAGTWVVFEQNLEVGRRLRAGDVVDLAWDPRHSFTLRGDQDLHAGLDAALIPGAAP